MINVVRSLLWQGADKVYALPWLRHQVEIPSEPVRIAQFVKHRFTRSPTLITLLSTFHLSRNSILVSSDAHAAHMRSLLLKSFPTADAYPAIAAQMMERMFDRRRFAPGEHKMDCPPEAVRTLYITLLETMLGVKILPPLRAVIDQTDFSPGWRPLRLEALLYSLPINGTMLRLVCRVLDLGFFRQARRMRRVSAQLEALVRTAAEPLPGSWLDTLYREQQAGRITQRHVAGEVTAMLVSSFSLASTLSFCLLCLSAAPWYIEKIRRDPDFARHFLAEVLRLYPPFQQFGYRSLSGPGADPGPSADFLISALFLHRNPSLWDLPNSFRPERFEEAQRHQRFGYLPFGMGARLCPGRSYALRLLGEAIKAVCRADGPVTIVPRERMPLGSVDRIISFPRDGTFAFRIAS